MKFFNSKDLGFATDAIITSYLPVRDEVVNERFRSMMMASPLVSDVSFSLSQPTGSSNSHSNFNYEPLKSEINYNASYKVADERYFDFFDLELLAGRSIRKNDSSSLIVINRRIADLMGFRDNYDGAVGEKLNTGWGGDKQIIGVMDNFETASLNTPIADQARYVIILRQPNVYYSMQFKVANTQNLNETLAHFKESWEKVYAKYVFDYDFFDEELAERYEYEQRVSDLMRIFAVISIVIGCLGLYGLISFIAINKTKEIGVRKVLGASIFNILNIFTKEIVVLMVLAFFVAGPLSYFALNEWLNTYPHRIEIGMLFFVIAFGITLVIALLTISHRTISSALLNPAKTLKDE